MRCGRSASAPNLPRRCSSYASKLPSNQTTWESPSKASTCVATRSRNQRSCEMITAQPANESSACSSARSVSTSRSLVGSSSSSRLPPRRSSLARCTRLRSPPDSAPTLRCWSEPRKLKPAAVALAHAVRLHHHVAEPRSGGDVDLDLVELDRRLLREQRLVAVEAGARPPAARPPAPPPPP